MPEVLKLQIETPIRQVDVLHVEPRGNDSALGVERQVNQRAAQVEQRAEALEQEFVSRKAKLEQTARALRAVGEELAKLREQMIEDMRREAVTLAMDIARKVLHQEIHSKEYEIDPIVAEALSRLPRRGEITVRLHPNDFERSGLVQGESNADEWIHFTADPNVAPAGCVVGSVEGSVESTPDASMEQIEKTLREKE